MAALEIPRYTYSTYEILQHQENTMERSRHCFFLDYLPPELRLNVYEYLVLADQPLGGSTARRQSINQTTTGLDLNILQTNRQIYSEAKAVFLGKNEFYISSLPTSGSADGNGELEDLRKRLEPCFKPEELPSLRHLTIDPVFRSAEVVEATGSEDAGKPVDAGAAEYITALTTLLQATHPHLRTLRLTTTPPSHLTTKQILTSFFTANRSPYFALALASYAPTIASIPIAFEFPECYYRGSVMPEDFLEKSIMLLACQVMFSRGQVRIWRMMREFEQGEGEVERVGLEELVEEWPGRVSDLEDEVLKEKELEGVTSGVMA